VYSDGSSTQDASLTLNNCTLSENTANFGGAIYSDGFDQGNSTLILNASTLDGNTASSEGGAIYCDGFDGGLSSLSLNSCTLTNNSSASFGGAIYNDGSSNGSSSISITNSTITANSASAEGGAIYSDGFDEGTSTLLLTHSILANNSAPLGPDLRETDEETGAITTAVGQNLISSTADTNISSDSPELTLIDGADLGLAPLGDYGGLTRTMIPLAGSPAIDAAPSSTRTHDQRGFAISDGSPDIGAVESQGDDMLTLFWNIDTDGDGTPFGVEFALGTDPLVPDPGHPNNLKISRPNDGDISLSFSANPDALGEAVWIIERSSDLRTWTTLFSSSTPSETTTVMDDSTQGTVYYRFRANQQ